MEYTWAALASVVVVVALEIGWLKTGIFTTASYWISYGIIVFFQILVDGWLTKLSAPIVEYSPAHFTGWRVPFDIPVEDYLFGFSLVTLTIMLWVRAAPGRRVAAGAESGRDRPSPDGGASK